MAKRKQQKSKEIKSVPSKTNFFKKLGYTKEFVLKHKLVTFLVVLLLIPVFALAQGKYKDWDNAQLIKGLARDFPVLVIEIESTTGLELEQKTDCSITTEKFTAGVKTCELTIVSQASDSQIIRYVEAVESNRNFERSKVFQNDEGYKYRYRNKNSCSVRYIRTIYISCITAVREANVELAREVFLK